MNQKEYSASMVKIPFWFLELKKVMQLMGEGLTLQDVKQKNLEENIFSSVSLDRAISSYNAVARRIQALESSYIDIFQELDVTNQKIIALIALMNSDKLFFEFMHEVVREKLILGLNELEERDFNIFFKNKQTQDERVNKWTEATLKKLSNSYKNVLISSGIAYEESKGKLFIKKPILDLRLEELIINTKQTAILDILQGVR